MNSKTMLSIAVFALVAASGLLLPACNTANLKPKAALLAQPCDLGSSWGGDITDKLIGGSVDGTNLGRPNYFNTYGGGSCGDGATGPDMVYRFTITNAPVDILFSTCNDADFDTLISLWTDCEPGTDESGHYIDCADDDIGPCGGNTTNLTHTFTENGTYYVVVDGYDEDEIGSFTLTTAIQP